MKTIAGVFIAALTSCLFTSCEDDSGGPTRPSNGVIEMTASTFQFNPGGIAFEPGDEVTIRLRSADMGHTLTIDALNVNVDIPAGDTTSAQLNGVSEGTYTFYCSVPGHRQQGMEGTLSVTRRAVSTTRTTGTSTGGY